MNEYQTPYAAPEPAPRGSSRTWIWVVLLALILPMFLCAGICGGLIAVTRSTKVNMQERVQEAVTQAVKEGAQAAPPFRMALQRVQADPDVQTRLGQPIRESVPSVFNYQDGTDGGNAEFRYQINGPQGNASVHVVAKKIDDQWWFETLDVTFADGETLDLADVELPIEL
jgi:hypothetical protein